MREMRSSSSGDLYEAAPCGLMVTDSAGLILGANATACRWLGYGADELVGAVRWRDLLTVGGRIFHQTHLAPLLRMQGSVAEVKLELRHKDGRAVPMILNMVERAEGTDLQVHLALFVTEDRHKYERELLLERKRAQDLARSQEESQRQLANAQEQLRAALAQAQDRALFAEQMMGVVSHDLRNPLNVITMSTYLLERMDLGERERKALARVAQSARHAERLINDLLDFTQVRLGRGLSLHPAPMRLHDVVADAVSSLRVAFSGHVIEHVHRGDTGCSCEGDAERVAQVIGNLVGNAVSYGDPDRPITVESGNDPGRCQLSVHNFGAPIPPDKVGRLFDPMVRGGDHASRGVGLGLYIVREIARAHGGGVEVRSTAGEGTTFTVRLASPA
jgi:sigma-B regulation protein RsbU (phosphoserine phosphatase)